MRNQELSDVQKAILVDAETETPFSGALLNNKLEGTYHCAQCDNGLFASIDKFDSHSGWPSFANLASDSSVKLNHDTSQGLDRYEVVCKACGGHLGHVFDDGPKESGGKRYCINSAALNFKNGNTSIRGDGKL